MIQKSAMTGLTRPQALFRFNQAKTRPGAVVEMIEQGDGNWTVSITWDDTGIVLSHNDINAFSKAESIEPIVNGKTLGELSKKFESNGNPGAIGFDSTGGYSYGSYQLASKIGRVQQFIDFLKKDSLAFASALEAGGGDQAARDGTDSFRSVWRTLASDPAFGAAQHDYIAASHYEPFAKLLLDDLGLDLSMRSPALRDVAWSVAVQHGPGNKVFTQALGGLVMNQLKDEDIISKVYSERSKVDKYFASSSEGVKLAVSARFKAEMSQALQLLA